MIRIDRIVKNNAYFVLNLFQDYLVLLLHLNINLDQYWLKKIDLKQACQIVLIVVNAGHQNKHQLKLFSWLEYHGVEKEDIKYLTSNDDYLCINDNHHPASGMLDTELIFGFWNDVKDDYSVPNVIVPHLDFISPSLRFPLDIVQIKLNFFALFAKRINMQILVCSFLYFVMTLDDYYCDN